MQPITSSLPIEQFVSNLLPNNNANAFDAVVTTLQSQNVLVSTGQSKGQQSSKVGYGFTSLNSLFRSHSPTHRKIVEALRTVCMFVSGTLECLGIRGHNSLSVQASQDDDPSVTACLSNKLEGSRSSFNVAVPITVLPRERTEEDVEIVMERIGAIMNDDARRIFAYGITIRHEKMVISRFSRSQVIHSLPFDWTESPDILIQVIISFLTATDEQLGYDPFVTMLPGKSYIYQIPPGGKGQSPLFYQTLQLISHYPSTSLGDRNARIWRVKQIVSPNNQRRVAGTSDRVLKDVWVDTKMRTEAEIQEDLFHDISAVTKDTDWRKRPIFQDFFERDVEALAQVLQGDNFKRYFSCIVAKCVREFGHHPASSPTTTANKRRCFFVYESVCTPIHDVPTFGEVIDILNQCVIALRLMFCAGWVHRDISAGNILAFRSGPEQPWQVKLSDLEYSRKFPDPNHPEGEQLMGTPFFMPCEIQMEEHILPIVATRAPTPEYPDKPMVYGYQHDLESIWWMLLWFATMRVDRDLDHEFGERYFQQPMDRHCIGRRWSLLRSQKHLSALPMLKDSLPSELLESNFLDELQSLKYQLHGEYMIRNADGKQEDIGTYSYVISQSFTRFFGRLETSRALWDGLKLSTTTEREASTRPYRTRPNQNADEGVGSHGRDSGGVRIGRKPVEKRRRMDNRPQQDRPTKRARFAAPVPAVEAPIRRSGPVTRSMTRAAQNIGPVTRAAARRMREAAASKNKTTTTIDRKSRR